MRKTKSISLGLLLAAVAMGILELVLYIRDGRTSFDPNYSVYAFVGMGLGIGFGALGLVLKARPLAFVSYLGFLYGLIHYVVSQINLIANILYGVDGSTFSLSFYVTMGAAVLSVVLALSSGITMKPTQK